jgi:hypothetical protein
LTEHGAAALFWQGVVYTKALHTGWKPKLQHRRMTLQQHQDVSLATQQMPMPLMSVAMASCVVM